MGETRLGHGRRPGEGAWQRDAGGSGGEMGRLEMGGSRWCCAPGPGLTWKHGARLSVWRMGTGPSAVNNKNTFARPTHSAAVVGEGRLVSTCDARC